MVVGKEHENMVASSLPGFYVRFGDDEEKEEMKKKIDTETFSHLILILAIIQYGTALVLAGLETLLQRLDVGVVQLCDEVGIVL